MSKQLEQWLAIFVRGSYDRLAFCRDGSKTHEDKASDCDGTIKAACLDNAFDALLHWRLCHGCSGTAGVLP